MAIPFWGILLVGIIWSTEKALPLPGEQGTSAATLYTAIPAEVPATSTLRGIVVDEDGKPVSGAPVTAFGLSGEQKQQQTDEKGGFVFENLSFADCGVQVDDPRFAKEWLRDKRILLPRPGDQPPLTLKLSRPRTLRGVVVNEAGDPIPGATVILTGEVDEKGGSEDAITGGKLQRFVADESAKPLGNDAIRKCVTDSKGRFHFERLRPARVVISVQHSGGAESLHIVEVVPNEIRLTVDKGFVLRGQVTADGKPLENVLLEISPFREIRTNAAGEFVTGIPRLPKEMLPAMTAPLPGETVHPLAAVSIEDPVWEGDYYYLVEQKDGTLPFVEIKAFRKDPEGATYEHEAIWLGSKELDRMQAKRKGLCSVVVRMEEDPRVSSETDRMVWVNSMSYDEEGESIYRSGNFKRNGTATFRDLPPGEYWVGLLNSGSPHYLSARTNLTTGTVEITLRKGPARVKGTIQCADGLTTEGVVRLSPAKGTQGGGCGTNVRKDGTYEVEGLAFGSYDVSYRGNRRCSNFLPLTITQPETRFDIPLPTGRIRGRVVPAPARRVVSWVGPGMMPGMRPGLSPPGTYRPGSPSNRKPQYQPNINLYRRPFVSQPNRGRSPLVVEATTDEQGGFEMQTPPPGIYALVCGDCRASVEVESSDSQIEVTLKKPDKTGEITGRVLGFAPARYEGAFEVNSPYIAAYIKDGQGYDFSAPMGDGPAGGENRTYRLRNLPVGVYGLLVSGKIEDGTSTLWVPGVEVREGLSRTQDIEVPKGRDVGIQARGREHTSIQRGWRLCMPNGDWLPSAVFWGGVHLPFGEYEIESFWEDRPSVREKFSVVEGKNSQMVFLRPMPQ